MNDNLQNNSESSFEELLSAALQDCINDQPRPGLDHRILANLPARRFPVRWPLWAPLAAAAALAIIAIALHSHRSFSPPTISGAVPRGHGGSLTANSDVIVATPSVPHARANPQPSSPAIAPVGPQKNVAPPSWESLPSPQQVPSASEEAEATTPPPTISPNGEVTFKPIHIIPLVIPPLPGADATADAEPPVPVEPIRIAPIQISSLKIDRLDTNP